ncbi:MAG: sigma-54 dependent transcriptional regulator [Planctomycetota bacterium]
MPELDDRPTRVLVIDDEVDHAEVMSDALERQQCDCDLGHSLDDAKRAFRRKRYDVVVTDLRMDGDRDGLEVLKLARALEEPPPVILVTAVNDVPTSKEAIREGVYDYITKPLDLEDFRAQVARAAEKSKLRRRNKTLEAEIADVVVEDGGFEGIIGNSAAMKKLIETAKQVARSTIPVLVLGESGTGKELVAKAIHQHSDRRKQRLVALNCAGLSESILEDELFGHVKGAFTGAQSDRAGRFEHADGGTLFLDEIGDMPAAMQAKLLRVLENGEVVRLGSNEPRQVDVRVVSATNRDIEQMVADKEFREDLYFRIKGVTLRLPALRERREDIPLLLHFFVRRAAEQYGREIDKIAPEVQQAFMANAWPGNVRQLKSAVDNLVVMSSGDTIGPDDLPPELSTGTTEPGSIGGLDGLVGISIEQAEVELIRNTLKLVDGNRERAAKILKIGERTLYRKIKEYDL